MAAASHRRVSTYRLQFRPRFGLTDASNVLPYLDDLSRHWLLGMLWAPSAVETTDRRALRRGT